MQDKKTDWTFTVTCQKMAIKHLTLLEWLLSETTDGIPSRDRTVLIPLQILHQYSIRNTKMDARERTTKITNPLNLYTASTTTVSLQTSCQWHRHAQGADTALGCKVLRLTPIDSLLPARSGQYPHTSLRFESHGP